MGAKTAVVAISSGRKGVDGGAGGGSSKVNGIGNGWFSPGLLVGVFSWLTGPNCRFSALEVLGRGFWHGFWCLCWMNSMKGVGVIVPNFVPCVSQTLVTASSIEVAVCQPFGSAFFMLFRSGFQ